MISHLQELLSIVLIIFAEENKDKRYVFSDGQMEG